MDERPKIVGAYWLSSALLLVGLGAIALSPCGPIARAGRALFAVMLLVHVSEAVYAAFRGRSAGLSAQGWFLRPMVLGGFALLTL